MAFPIAAVAAGAAAIGGSVYNGIASGKASQKDRDHAYSMWQQQQVVDYDNWVKQNQYNENIWAQQKDYNQGLWNQQNAYNEMLWNKQNEYDSPARQMQRFKEAGLNPNLIYGGMSNSGSIQTANLEPADPSRAAPIHTSEARLPPSKAPQFDLVSGLMAYNQFRNQAAQTNNLEAQNEAIEASVLLTNASVEKTIADTKKVLQDTEFGRSAFDNNLEAIRLQVQRLTQQIGQSDAMFGLDLEEKKHNISNLDKTGKGMDLDQKMKGYLQNMREQGFEVTDPWYFRMMDDARAEKMMKNLKNLGRSATSGLFGF